LKALEIGSEPTLAEHIAKLVEVFRDVRRVLRKDGTLWLNYGDMWCSTDKWGGGGANTGLKPKDLCMAPHRLAIALQDDGWWVRSDIVWHKPNPMPSSVTDRPTPAKEFVFLLSKSPRYYYDAQAIAEPSSWQPDKSKMPDGWDTGAGGHGSFHRQGREKGRPSKNELTGDRRKNGFNGRWDEAEADGSAPMTRNARDVWTIASEPFPDGHYATFPTALAERCVKAGCPEGGTVLDPFGGSGTVGLVADRLGLGAILIDIDPANEAMAERRIARDRLARKQGTMADVAAAKLPPTPLEALMQDEAP
jgi:DNA modification methylase